MKIAWPGRHRLETRIAELEVRADSSYTDALIASLVGNATGKTALPTATAALEAAAGLVGRSFASAEIAAPDMAAGELTPGCMAMIGRALIRRGEIVLMIRVQDGELHLLPCASHDIDGGPIPSTWRYRCSIGGPERTETYDNVPAEGVVHIQYSRDPETPWRGNGPLGVARLAGSLSAETAKALSDESSMPRGAFLPLPVDGQDPTAARLKADIGKAAGDLLTVEAGDWDAADAGKATSWAAERFGPDPPAALVELHALASREIFAACGVPPALYAGDSAAAGLREAYRQFLHSTCAPLGRIVAAELSRKLEGAVSLTWEELRAGDIAGRARAFGAMVTGGMDLAKAAALAGLMVDGDA